MFRRVLAELRAQVRGKSFIVTGHALDEAEEDGLTVYDIEHVLLTGEISIRQVDPVTRERKYVVGGTCLSGRSCEVVIKFGPTGRLVIITVYLL